MSQISPNFIIAGEGKAGSTALYSYLTQHPEVFMCEPKEPRYFAFRNRRPDYAGLMDEETFNRGAIYQRDDYYKLFESAAGKLAIGEASPVYIHTPGCAAAIAEELPDVKIIVLLRQPTQLAFSAYQHMVRLGLEHLSFEDALAAEPERIRLNWALHWRYGQLGFVSENIEKFLQHFPKEQILFIKYDDFNQDNFAVLRQVCTYLGIASDFNFAATRTNVNARPRLVWLRKLEMTRNDQLRKLVHRILPVRVRLAIRTALNFNMRPVQERPSLITEKKLTARYREDILKCQTLTGLNLVNWLDTEEP